MIKLSTAAIEQIKLSAEQGQMQAIPLRIAIQRLEDGMIIDFVELEPGKQEFIFLNPNDPAYVPPQK